MHVTDHLLSLCFSDNNEPYSNKNIEFFLNFVNKQSDWILFSKNDHVTKPDDLQFTGCITLAKLKCQLNKILQVGWSKNG